MENLFNKFQSSIEDLNIDNYPLEIKEAFYDFLTNVPYIKSLISPNRPYAKDCPRDEEGKIIVDLTNPPIIEDTDYFRPNAIHYKKYGNLTNLRPNPNPNSEYGKWVREEVRRIFFGYVRESDGAWVTGDMYFFLNYCPIIKVKRVKGKLGVRVVDFPDFLEGQWLKFMYIKLARDSAKHGSELASRGKGKAHPYSERVFTPDGWKLWGDILVGDTLYSDMGLPTKVIDIPYNEESDIYRVTLADGRTVNCTSGHLFRVYNHKLKREEIKSLIDIQQDYICPRKLTAKNTKGREFNYRIPKNGALRISFKEVPIDPYTLGVLLGDGCFRSKNKNNVGFTTKYEDYLSCYRDNIPYEIYKVGNDSYSYNIKLPTNLFGDLWNKKSEDKYVPDEYKYNSDSVRLSVLLGLMDTDGTVTFGTPIFTTTSKRLKEDVLFIARSLGFTCTISSKIPKYNGKEYRRCYNIRIYATVPIFRLQRKQNLVYYKNTARVLNTSIVSIEYLGKEKAKCVTVDSPTHCYLINDLVVTHNSYTMASILARRFILGEYNPVDKKIEGKVESFVASYLKNYLNEDGVLNKFESYIDFCSENTEFPKKRLTSSINQMHWQMGYKENESVAKKGTLNEVIGVSVKDSPGKLRGKRGAFIGLEEFGSFPNLIELYGTLRPSMEDGDIVFGMIYCQGCVCAGTKVWTLDGRNINIENLTTQDGIVGYTIEGTSKLAIGTLITPSTKLCVELTLSNGNTLRCSIDHPILKQVLHTPRIKGTEKRHYIYEEGFIPASMLKVGDKVCEAREIEVFGESTLFDARLIGMLIGDGSYGYNNTPKYSSLDTELLLYVESKYDTAISASHITKEGKLYKDIRVKGICKKLREIGIYGQTKTEKRLPLNYQTLTYQDTVDLLGGLFDTDGSITFNKLNTKISITQSNNIILEEIKVLLRKLGIICNISKINPRIAPDRKDVNPYYTLSIAGRENIYFFNKHLRFLVSYKQETLDKAVTWFNDNPSTKPCNYNWKLLKPYKIVSIKDIGVQTIYNLSAICSRTYLANNIITHNTAGDKESDFSAAQKIMYSPRAFNMLPIPNVYDKLGLGKQEFVYFYPAYVNRNGCYNKDGISDVTKAILEVLINRYNVKYNTTDANLIIKTIAELPIVPQEAIMRTRGNLFPVLTLNERINQLDNNPNIYDDIYIGNLNIQRDGTIKFSNSIDLPIREYPLNDNSNKGAIEIFEMPQKDSNGRVFQERYIMGLDPVDDDVAHTTSLTSVFVLDLLTDRIVAEYTGRQEYADDNFEIVRRLCLFYNAKCLYESNKKGIFAYFNKMNALQYLAETPVYLKDQLIIKEIGYGNKSRGVNASAAVNSFADRLTREWLIKPVQTITVLDELEVLVTLPNLMFIRNRAFLLELVAYDPKGNFDRIRAFGMLMLYRQEKIILYLGDMNKTIDEDKYKDLAENDEFFTLNFDERFELSLFEESINKTLN